MKKNFLRFLTTLLIFLLFGCETKNAPPHETTTSVPENTSPHDSAPLPLDESATPPLITSKDDVQMVHVPAGVFKMGRNDGAPAERPRMNVFLEGFYIDRFEISNERFAKFVSETSYNPMRNFKYKKEEAQLPAQKLSWEDVKAYCEWAGKRLPTEYEWEKAARGMDGRKFPWGDDEKKPSVLTLLHEYQDPTGQSPYGCLHMADNVWEWVEDWFLPYPLSDWADPRFGEIYKVIRGGLENDSNNLSYSLTTTRRILKPSQRIEFVGGRCAMDEIR